MSTLKEHEAVLGGGEAAGIAIAAGSQPTQRGVHLLQTPLLNKGTAFTEATQGVWARRTAAAGDRDARPAEPPRV